jgi:hypothetical protein
MYYPRMDSLDLAIDNLTSVAVLVFAFGFLAARLKSDVRIPDAVYQVISVYLLLGIGLKGGHALHGTRFGEFLGPAAMTIGLGIVIPFLAFFALGFMKRIERVDRGSIAAHYGSTSLVTFSAALLFIESNGVKVEGYATALLTLLEIPGIIIGIYLGSRATDSDVKWGKTLLEVFLGKTVLLLLGGIVIGFITSEAGFEKVKPFFIDLQGGILALFLLHLGYMAGTNLEQVRRIGFRLVIFGITFPIFAGSLGAIGGHFVGLSVGGTAILAVLCASSSYIAAPAAVGVALPRANLSLALTSSIGITFPFNLVFGIPLYLEIARFLN